MTATGWSVGASILWPVTGMASMLGFPTPVVLPVCTGARACRARKASMCLLRATAGSSGAVGVTAVLLSSMRWAAASARALRPDMRLFV